MTKIPTKNERQEWQRLADAATPGPWRAGREDMVTYHGIYGSSFKAVYWDDPEAEMHMGHTLPGLISEAYDAGEVDCRDNAGFIAAARTAVPSLLAALDTLEAERDQARAGLAASQALVKEMSTALSDLVDQIEAERPAIDAPGGRSLRREIELAKAVLEKVKL